MRILIGQMIPLVLVFVTLFFLGCTGDTVGDDDGNRYIYTPTDGDTTDGDTADGDATDGDVTDGDVTDGDITDGDVSDGDTTDGDVTDGDATDGDVTDGDATDGDATDGDTTDGDTTDGDVTDGDVTDGDVTDGDVSDGDITDGDTESPHEDGWDHGNALLMGELDCRMCHGETLTGGSSGMSCDTCHESGWRQNCTFCHGGVDNATGAPPENLSDETDPSLGTVGAHTAHVSSGRHMTYDCNQCHVKPVDLFSEDHFFDATPGKAEVNLAAGLSGQGQYDGNGNCSSLYCHGNGQGANGSGVFTGQGFDCDGCHPYLNSSEDAWNSMSGKHKKHLGDNLECWECHNGVLDSSGQFVNSEWHANGFKDIQMINGGTWTANTCTVTCHGKFHFARSW